ncbi:glutamine-hydrolyzing GMP synthase [Candidatus Anaplasma sp. TIGMIC]|uniref:glutamine-hydrolyzing GMP synthase n=1 Tax=Candidatus Anaplasma sp. TIGMIC TaxID=3020713 RepID=UPI00232C8783|nr:glutamine-hydrolyzing GMP synthase [Candidatus Anaplasma sp. TIGMIC]MDB1135622.1 glutamine-hydrolyzing GMP synthase [Candidatus Anaplasma sp. TIGMIC]
MFTIAIIDFGSQVTQLIARRVRELGVYSEVFPVDTDFFALMNTGKQIAAFILSGGPDSVADLQQLPKVVTDVLDINAKLGTPVLGICYGFQLLAHNLGIRVEQGNRREFGNAQLAVVAESAITKGIWSVGGTVRVWMSHSDSVVDNMPESFRVVARSAETGAVAFISNEEKKIYGLQFHPEVSHTPDGRDILNSFLTVVGCTRDWTVKTFLHTQIDDIKNTVGGELVVAAISGGVDSSVSSVLVHKAIGDRLKCVFVDTGCLRKGEVDAVQRLFVDKLGMSVSVVMASSLFLDRLSGVVDPEEKRMIIGNTFIEVFEKEAERFGDVKFLMQGTIYPDVIESGVSGSGVKIKSHHNVGGLPDRMKMALVEPIRCLFKDEVRSLGRELGLPDVVLERHPFPGPGLAVRVIGEVTEEKLALLREVDSIYIDALFDSGLYHDIWQAFAVLMPSRTVGVMGDSRTYGYVCGLRAVTSNDGMTADSFPFGEPPEKQLKFLEFLQKVGGAIVRGVPGINRVVYDITSKPPATIEWE